MRKTAYFAVLCGLVGAVALTTTAASAEEPDCKTVTSQLTDRPDSGLHGTWATDTLTRTVVLCQTGEGVYEGTVTDTGTFVTIDGLSPGAGVDLPAGVTGKVAGGFTADFTATPNWENFTPVHDGQTYSGADPATSTWIKAMFGEVFAGTSINDDWAWTYTTCNDEGEKWVNAAAGNEGDITGKACPEPPPSPSPSEEPSEEPSPEPSEEPSEEPSPEPSESESPSAAPSQSTSQPPLSQAGNNLPITGSPVATLIKAGVTLLVGGALIFWFQIYMKRRRVGRLTH